jgi:GNAT superfamily N-acetyltransferase
MMILLIDQVWFSDDKQILELVNFVHPEHRRSNYAKTLVEYAKHCSDATGLDLTIGVLSNVRMEAKVKLYERQLPKAGAFFVYSPKRESVSIAAE